MQYTTLLVEIAGPIAMVTLNRPEVLNALNAPMLRELDECFAALGEDSQVRAVVLRGAGAKAFAAGADIAELAEADANAGEQIARRAQRVFRRIEILGKPVIACIYGYALGGGCELALACTLRLAGDSARFGQPEIKLGLVPGFGGMQRLARLIGRSAALTMILTGEIVTAADALRLGLVDEVVAGDGDAALMSRAHELATHFAAMPPLAVAGAIEAVTAGADLPMEEATALDARIFGRLCGTEDKREGTRAFLEKRPAVWRGL